MRARFLARVAWGRSLYRRFSSVVYSAAALGLLWPAVVCFRLNDFKFKSKNGE